MKKFKKGLLLAIASLSVSAMSGCDFFEKELDINGGGQQQETQKDEDVAVTSVTLDKESLDLFVTDSVYLRATVAPENATNKYLTWSSSNEDVAIVSATGKVTALGEGEADIKVESQADATKNATCHVKVTIKDDTVHVTSVTLDYESANMYVGNTMQLTATVLPENATNKGVSFSSDNESVAFVNASGSVVAVGDGDAVITAASNENPAKFATCNIHVTTEDTTVYVTGLSVTPTELIFDLGGETTAKPTVTISPENATNKAVTWSSSDPSKVVVDAQGNIVAVAVTSEPVTVTVASVENPLFSQTISVTVVDTRDTSIHVDSVTLQEELTIDLKTSNTGLLTATVAPSNAGNKAVNWSSSDTSVVTIGSAVGETSVTLNALKTGTSTITATSVDGGHTDTCLVTVVDSKVYVENVIIKQNNAAITDLDITLGSFEQVVASVLPANADEQGIVWEMQDGASDYISLSATSGSNLTIFGNVATPENTSFVVTAKSVENGAIKATLNVTVTDPTIYAESVGIQVEGLSGYQTSANVENTRTIKISAVVTPANTTNPEIEWVIPTNSKIVTTENVDHSLNILGKDLTEGTPVVIRARVKAQPSIYSEISINVIDPTSVDRFVSFVDPADYIKYKGHIAPQNLEDAATVQSRDEFSANFYEYAEGDAEKYLYKVGDQGVFHFAPTAYVKLAGQTAQTPVSNVASSKKLVLIEGSNETDVTNSMSTYCSIDNNTNDYTFTSEAVGKTFRLELLPNDPNYYASKTIESYDFTFKVVHGYNVDSLAELSLFDNTQSAWSLHKNLYGLTNPAEGGIILHKDISITADIIPSQFVMNNDDFAALNTTDFNTWANNYFVGSTDAEKQSNAQEAFIGSPKDYTTIFKRNTKDEDFVFEGNFFQVDFSALKPVYLIDSGDDTLMGGLAGDGSHAQFFGVNNNFGGITTQHSVTMRNFSLRGNGGLEYLPNTNTLDVLRKGGLIAYKLDNADFTIENAIVSNSFISFLTEGYPSATGASLFEMNADRVTVYNAYSNMFYLFGSPNNHVTNSWMSKSGGPLVLMDEPLNGNNTWYRDNTSVAVSMDCTNCYLKNEVMGTEPWFEGHAGSGQVIQAQVVTPGLPALAAESWYYVAAYQSGETGARTIARKVDDSTKYCDLICIDVRASSFADNDTYNLRGSFSVNNGTLATAALNMNYVARDSEGYFPLIPKAVNAYGNMAPYLFNSNEGAVGVLGNDGLAKATSVDLFTNKYTAAYMNPMYNQSNLADPNNVKGRYIGVFLGTYAL